MKRSLVTIVLALVAVSGFAQAERATARERADAGVIRGAQFKEASRARATQSASVVKRAAKRRAFEKAEAAHASGVYVVENVRCDPTCRVVWRDTVQNLVTTVGKNLALDTLLGGSSYTVTGPYLGLISSVSYTAGPVVADTMASHGGWTEAGGTNAPTYSGARKTALFSAAAAGSKALSSALSYANTSNGTVKGCFLVLGSGALSTVDNTSGTLYSAGTFSAGDKAVSSGDTLNVSYSAAFN